MTLAGSGNGVIRRLLFVIPYQKTILNVWHMLSITAL
jgi:hypothetical protein